MMIRELPLTKIIRKKIISKIKIIFHQKKDEPF